MLVSFFSTHVLYHFWPCKQFTVFSCTAKHLWLLLIQINNWTTDCKLIICGQVQTLTFLIKKIFVLQGFYIITRKLHGGFGDMKFLFLCWKIFHSFVAITRSIFFQLEKRNFTSPCSNVIYSRYNTLWHIILQSWWNLIIQLYWICLTFVGQWNKQQKQEVLGNSRCLLVDGLTIYSQAQLRGWVRYLPK